MTTWTDELKIRCLAAGYGDVLIGACDVEGLDKNGVGFCRQKPHGVGPCINERPAIGVILREMEIPTSSSGCHWVGWDRQRMTSSMLKAIDGRVNWVRERE